MFAQVKPTLDQRESGLGIGLSLSKALMELHEGTLEAPSSNAATDYLVAVTGWGQEDDLRRALAAGFDTHLVKPVDFTEVSELCRRIAASHPG